MTIIVPVRETLSSHVRPPRAQDQSEAKAEATSSPAAPLPPDGGPDRDRAIDAQAFAAKQRQRDKAHLSVDMRLVVQNDIQQ